MLRAERELKDHERGIPDRMVAKRSYDARRRQIIFQAVGKEEKLAERFRILNRQIRDWMIGNAESARLDYCISGAGREKDGMSDLLEDLKVSRFFC